MNEPPEQLDLLSWQRPFTLVAFPPARRASVVRAIVAEMTKRKPGSRAFWRYSDKVFSKITVELTVLGFDEGAIDMMLEDLAAEVLNERDRQKLKWRFDDRGGAA
jgi:hypothetical protein